MSTRLVFIHGRAQENKDAGALKEEWVSAFCAGLDKSELPLPLSVTDIKFPYYGQTLYDLVSGADNVDEVLVRGSGMFDEEQRFQLAVLQEVQKELHINDEEVAKTLHIDIARLGRAGFLNNQWVLGILKTIDQHVPGASGASIALATRDVYQYLKNPGIRDAIESGVRQAMLPSVPTVVVSHSLGTLVAYNLLRREGKSQGWQVPLLVTLGSPLAVKAIKDALAPIEHPDCVTKWFNAMDKRDIVALYPLEGERFKITPEIENKTDVQNNTSNCHGISGYLDDAEVACLIHNALS